MHLTPKVTAPLKAGEARALASAQKGTWHSLLASGAKCRLILARCPAHPMAVAASPRPLGPPFPQPGQALQG